MTPLEGKIRRAIHAKASEVPGTVPPLQLPAGRRRSFSLAYGGGESLGAPAWRGWLVPAASAVLVAAVVVGSGAISRVLFSRPESAGLQQATAQAVQNEAAGWVADQVSRYSVVACDPVMCRKLLAHGIAAAQLVALQPGRSGPLGAGVIVATAAVRRQFGGRFNSVYAPVVIARFGSGNTQIDIRLTAPAGAAAYRTVLKADMTARKVAGTQMLENKRIVVTATARRQLADGQVDPRLLIIIATLAARQPVSVLAFGDRARGASSGIPLRSADLTATGAAVASRAAHLRLMRTVLRAQRGVFKPTRIQLVRLAGGQTAVRIEYPAPTPLGLLGPGHRGG